MKAWCLFEQSGTFKNQFKKFGFDAVDVDIQNEFDETDFVIDLFSEIDAAYEGGAKQYLIPLGKMILLWHFSLARGLNRGCLYSFAVSHINRKIIQHNKNWNIH